MEKTRLRKSEYTYRLTVDPERLEINRTLTGKVLKILVDHGGCITRKDLLKEFTRYLKNNRPERRTRPSTELSRVQRVLQDEGILKIYDSNNQLVSPTTRAPLLRN